MRQKKWLLCVLALLLLAGLGMPALAEPDAIQPLRSSVVHLYAIGYDEEDRMLSRWTGTGFAVGIAGEESDLFLTNWHVVTGSGKYTPERVRLWLLRDDCVFDGKVPAPETSVECTVLATTEGYPDVAVIRAGKPVSGCTALPLMSSDQVPNGTPVYALGFPGMEATRYGVDSGPEDIVVTAGTVTDHLTMKSAGSTRSLIHSAAMQHGNSGGPLVNDQGVVVGLNTYGFSPEVTTELFCALYIDYAMSMLDDLGIAYTRADGPNRLAVLALDALRSREGLTVLAVCACGVLFICLPRKKK